MTQSLATSVAQLKQYRTTLTTYVDHIQGEYLAYVNGHPKCMGDQYVDGQDGGRSWHEYADRVGVVKGYIDEYIDDTEWIGQLRTRSGQWKTATGHALDASLDTDEGKFPAVSSWEGPAGNAYRKVVPTMCSAADYAVTGCSTMQSAAHAIAEAGQKFFADLEAAMGTLAGSLTHYKAPPLSLNSGGYSLSPQGAYPCGQLTHLHSAGEHPWTAYDSYVDAKDALRLAVTQSVRVTNAGGPANGFTNVDEFLKPWPAAPVGG
ncbi:hypothetical protein ACOCJ7_12230 [Knoellia sp. CPCC 206453]|uniref:hypothetical protein n=1 Tax=Knoellia pratensis TaxID=3404796 RepID=UPI00360C670D